MKKRILSVVCALAIVVGMIIPWTGDVHAAETTTCKCGATNVEWTKVEEGTTFAPGNHYRLERDVELLFLINLDTEAEAGTYCLDLAGHTMIGKNRTMVVKSGVIFNIMDSSADQTGKIMSAGTGAGGGVIYQYSGSIVNLYSGTVTSTDTSTVSANDGAVIRVWQGTLNMYGGKVIGGTASNVGGAIALTNNATFNMSGGSVTGGTAQVGKGNCVYAASGATVVLSKNAQIEEIYFEDTSVAASVLTIKGKYTGKVKLNFTTEPADGAQIGISDGANIGLENIYILTPRMYGTVSGNTLVATEHSGVAVKSGARTTCYDTLEAACANLKAGDKIKLLADNSENVTIPVDATLDLFGWDLTGNVNATGTLTLKDSATDDYTVNDPMGIGVVSGTITGNVQCAANYTAIKEADGTTYHKYLLKLTNVSLRPREAGVYYKADIKMDEMVREKQVQFGIAASVYDEEPSLESANTLYTSFGAEDYSTGTAKGALIKDFLDNTNNTVAQNTQNAQTNVYGRPYIQYTDEAGTHCLYGQAYGTNLKDVTEQVGNASRDSLKLVQKRALTDMYEAYENTLKTWDLSYLTTAAANKKAAADDGVLKMLLIGNSHALDSTRMLYEIFQKENPDQEVIIGVMYHSGANMGNHVSYMIDDLAQYEYHKNGDSDVDTKGDGSWWSLGTTTSGVKIERGLNNENWDIVALQEMNKQSATESEFQDDQIELVLDYVNEHLGYEPEIWWNMVWVNPQIPLTSADEFPDSTSGDSATGDEEQEGDGTNTTGEPALWIFPNFGGPTMKKAWISRYFDNWQNDRDVMFNDIVGNVETYVLEAGKQAKAYDVTTVVPVASAVQRAVDQLVNNSTYSSLLGTNTDMVLEDAERITTAYAEQVMYRDYTHMSELGRYITAYVWYAKLMELDSLSTLKCTAMPNYLRKGYEKDTTLETLAFTSTERALARDAINYALANPYATYPEPQS